MAWVCAILLVACLPLARAAESLPPVPANHFNDYARAVSPGVAQRLNAELAQYERETSNQLLVAIYPRMPSGSAIEDYTVRVFEAWKPGVKGRNNGAVLFVFTQDRRMRIATGYGLEGALPDALCKRIVDDEIAPRLRAGDFDGGMVGGVRAMIAAARGEYRGTGRTVREASNSGPAPGIFGGVFVLIFIAVVMRVISGRSRGMLYTGRRRRGIWVTPGGLGGWGGGGRWGGGGGGGGWSGGGGGSFSGGGGSTGGGGASGSW